ncbi:RlpA-like double-psi beta-barrel-protein domain-containing protein-containing protein [Cantharellus anzutake]|uniref:RlpA-like double-psi beta-barrel-protein domain-containing protein-containing protein n=1 Tax=Cantharellus anzutake TaxID=1750568 RepID=UPI0019042AE2|nr:RlpA-like double-psi beta-barrel-protein domain-containing protein-containing protein [Cantharellus anzutake]KAF8343165.1 RlpA-like double-psi beta-barrel-protein domain-containing protein-containing protein [Cantharellus anzutake]
MIAAASHLLWADFGSLDNPNNSPICGRYVIASYGGKSVRVKITDECMGCAKYSLDFSPDAFKLMANPDLGRIKITWRWA